MNSLFPLLHSDNDFKATSGKQIATPILADKIDPNKNTMSLQRQYRSLKKTRQPSQNMKYPSRFYLKYNFGAAVLPLTFKIIIQIGLMLYAHIDFKAAIEKQRSNKGEQFYKSSNGSSKMAMHLSWSLECWLGSLFKKWVLYVILL